MNISKRCVGKVCTGIAVIVLGALSALPAFAQDNKEGTLASLEFQRLKPGTSTQYEAGRKQKAAWHKSQNDSQPLFVWEVMSGDNTGTYMVGRLAQHWADLDKPSVPDQADLDEFNKVMGSYVDSVVTRYYEYLPKMSMPSEMVGGAPSKYAEIATFHVRYGHADDFRSGIERVAEAAKKTNWAQRYQFFVLVSGGNTGTYVLAEDHSSWSDFEDKPEVKPFSSMLTEAFGRSEAESIMHRFDTAIESETTEIIKFRGDLSYMPSK